MYSALMRWAEGSRRGASRSDRRATMVVFQSGDGRKKKAGTRSSRPHLRGGGLLGPAPAPLHQAACLVGRRHIGPRAASVVMTRADPDDATGARKVTDVGRTVLVQGADH
jgi:hypothetical protein